MKSAFPFRTFFDKEPLILMEAAVVERIRRSGITPLHPHLVNAPLIYDPTGRKQLSGIYNEYIDIAEFAGMPVFLCTPTWRTDYDRVRNSNFPQEINRDAVRFMSAIRSTRGLYAEKIKIGGLIGCKNDCYLPSEGLDPLMSEEYHKWQIEELVTGGVDFLIAETLPNHLEGLGMAKAMSKFEIPYFLSFVISRDGKILDGTDLMEAIAKIDREVEERPVAYLINCAHPSFLKPGDQPVELFARLKGYLANAAALDHCDLDGSASLKVDDIEDWSRKMAGLHTNYGLKILGGCCGTDAQHLRSMVHLLGKE
ncbi:MAG: homocysteine S-methyltransferase family protein [Saprospiraceae bacterium]|nr:homocysteine S-methyltransferase family protein [Saprospiraceae bacterium]